MIVLQLLALILFLAASIGPGLWLVRRLPWSAPERMCAAIGASGIALYLASALIYALHLPRFSHYVVSLGCIGLAVAGRAHARQLLANREVRRTLGGFALLFAWVMLLLAMVRNYSGGVFAGDWIEHFQRSQFFLEHQPADTLFTGIYPLTARPPFMNLLGSHFLALAGARYDLFQVSFAFLNLLVFFPCCLIARHMLPKGWSGKGRTVLLCLLAASPFFVENATYVATKGLTNACVILGLCFYLRAWRRSDPVRFAASGLAMSAGMLVHYSAAPYALLLVLHFGIFVLPRLAAGKRRAALMAALPGAALFATWLAWSAAVYGVGSTLASNTTAQAAGTMSLVENLRKIALNLYYTIVPHPLRLGYDAFADANLQPSSWGMFRDYFFTLLQTGLVSGMGCLGGVTVLYLLWKVAREPRSAAVGRRGFWLGFVLLATILTVATHPTVDIFGVAHVCSQPLLLLGLTFLAARFGSLPPFLRAAVIAGCAVDFLAGIFVQFSLQHWLPQSTNAGGHWVLELTTDLIGRVGLHNSLAREQLGYPFLGDRVAGLFPTLQVLVLLLFCGVLAVLAGAGMKRGAARRLGFGHWAAAGLFMMLGVAGIVQTRPKGRAVEPDPSGFEAGTQNVVRDPDVAAVRYNAGLTLYRRGDIGAAVEQWTEALVLQPDHARARYFSQIAVLLHAIPVTTALGVAEAVHRFPGSADARRSLSLELWNRKHPGPALRSMQEAVQLDPGFIDGFVNLGHMYLELDRLDDSVAAFESALKLDPTQPEIHYAIASAFFNLGRTRDAAAHLREALRLKPDFPEAQAALRQVTAPRM